MRIILLEDQYAPKIYKEIISIDKNVKFPIKWNIKNPLSYIKIIESIKDDFIILLDNYFPGKGYEEALWNLFLEKLLETWKNYKIICISDRWKRLLEDYNWWRKASEKWWILWWNKNKNWKEISKTLINN